MVMTRPKLDVTQAPREPNTLMFRSHMTQPANTVMMPRRVTTLDAFSLLHGRVQQSLGGRFHFLGRGSDEHQEQEGRPDPEHSRHDVQESEGEHEAIDRGNHLRLDP
jgi:hypothetical protein